MFKFFLELNRYDASIYYLQLAIVFYHLIFLNYWTFDLLQIFIK